MKRKCCLAKPRQLLPLLPTIRKIKCQQQEQTQRKHYAKHLGNPKIRRRGGRRAQHQHCEVASSPLPASIIPPACSAYRRPQCCKMLHNIFAFNAKLLLFKLLPLAEQQQNPSNRTQNVLIIWMKLLLPLVTVNVCVCQCKCVCMWDS